MRHSLSLLLLTISLHLLPPSLAQASTHTSPSTTTQPSPRQQIVAHLDTIEAQADQLRVPDFPLASDWFNSEPLSLKHDLNGKLVVLDFWTYCCINCHHVLPELAILEDKYRNTPVAFVGVHSAKFTNEQQSANIRNAIVRHGITHPVLNDIDMTLWHALGVTSWPTLVVLGPSGNIIYTVSGEGNGRALDTFLAVALEYYAGHLDYTPLPITTERAEHHSPLRYPTKLAIDPGTNRLFISDSLHNRIVMTDLDGRYLDAVGSGLSGLTDGACCDARFDNPQGLALHGERLYIADTENHALRVVDVKTKQVDTIAGTGSLGKDYHGGRSGSDQPLNSPWDVVATDDALYIAMAGTHQIWVHHFASGKTQVYSGNGSEMHLNSDNPLAASWAQPSGLAIGNNTLFVADSESSTIRAIDLATGASKTLAGGESSNPRNLFAYGDKDGVGEQARLQHPLGVVWVKQKEKLLVADTYNHRIRLIDPATGIVETLAGAGTPGHTDGIGGAAQFNEPSDLVLHPDGDKVYIADTNNHQIRLLDLDSKQVSTIAVAGVPPPAKAPTDTSLVNEAFASRIDGTPVNAAASTEGTLIIQIELPENTKLNDLAPSRWQLRKGPLMPISVRSDQSEGPLAGTPEIRLPYTSLGNEGTVEIEAIVFYCEQDKACLMEELIATVPFRIGAGGSAETVIKHKVKPLQP